LVITADCLALDDKLLSLNQQGQEDVNVNISVSKMADVDERRAGLRSVVPNDVAITRIAARRTRVGAVQEQAGRNAGRASRASRTNCG
jgi:hypothetical protein